MGRLNTTPLVVEKAGGSYDRSSKHIVEGPAASLQLSWLEAAVEIVLFDKPSYNRVSNR
jgi:hypothetical protein